MKKKLNENKMMKKSTGEVSLTTLVVVLGTSLFIVLAIAVFAALSSISIRPFNLAF